VRVHADGHRDVVDLGVGEEAVPLDLERVQDLAAQRQDRLVLLVARELGGPARRIALDEKDPRAATRRPIRSR